MFSMYFYGRVAVLRYETMACDCVTADNAGRSSLLFMLADVIIHTYTLQYPEYGL